MNNLTMSEFLKFHMKTIVLVSRRFEKHTLKNIRFHMNKLFFFGVEETKKLHDIRTNRTNGYLQLPTY